MSQWPPIPMQFWTVLAFCLLVLLSLWWVLLGSGRAFRFPDAARLAPLYKAGIGVEVMDTPAACRTYNILLGEGRNVIAALILD